MKKQLLIIGIIVLLVCVGFSGCTETGVKDSRFVGKWEAVLNNLGQTANFKFNSNGTGDSGSNGIYGSKITWYAEGNKLYLKYDDGSAGSFNFEFRNNNTMLILKKFLSSGNLYFIKK